LKLNIESLRKKHKLSKLELSKRAGVARGYICELEDGKYNNPSIKVL
jgi:transcriptional regulator with XRE-family HTH domain